MTTLQRIARRCETAKSEIDTWPENERTREARAKGFAESGGYRIQFGDGFVRVQKKRGILQVDRQEAGRYCHRDTF